ncbi:MAG TPA: Gfo/Idh/MocA family oxidoreductase [Solirubrobacterales bacterium]|jgi:predicted dehydrogenase
MIRVGAVGLGKMGLSHQALLGAHPRVELAAICDSSSYVLGVLSKHTGLKTYGDYDAMLAEANLDAVLIATPSKFHAAMVEAALERDLHVFCEKPLTLDPDDARRLATEARERGLVTQVGYHNRFVAAFSEVKALLEAGAIGEVTHAFGEAYGPVVLKAKGKTWRSQSGEGGGCLYDYAAHVINLLNWYLGEPIGVGGTVLPKVFSRETDDGAFSTLYFPEGRTGQISVNWSDESQRKMTTRINVWGTAGRIYADRQECQVYLRDSAPIPAGYRAGWNARFTTELTDPVWFYLRGEEYSAQIESFVGQVEAGREDGVNGFAGAAVTDRSIAMMVADAERGPSTPALDDGGARPLGRPSRRRRWRSAA